MLLMLAAACPAAATQPAMPADLQQWTMALRAAYLSSNPAELKPIIPVPGWPAYQGGTWYCQYPPDWSLLGGDPYFFMVADARRLCAYEFYEIARFDTPQTHESIGSLAFSRVAGNVSAQVADTFSKNIFPQLGLAYPEGYDQIWFLRWNHPGGGRMFTLMQVSIFSHRDFTGYGVPGIAGGTTANWSTVTAPEEEFLSAWRDIFLPLRNSHSYTIPKPGPQDSDGDGIPDAQDRFPYDPTRW